MLEKLATDIKNSGKGKKYDCILGISGGVDSTYAAYWASRLGLNPLVVHLDNGWNTELAVKNIEHIVSKLNFDLYTHVVRWEEFKDLHLSFLKSGVVDIELPTDHAIYALLLKTAKKHGIKTIISGYNIATEGVIPSPWVWNKLDWLNIKSIHQAFGTIPLKSYPRITFLEHFLAILLSKIKIVNILDYLDYDKNEAKHILTNELGWKDYGGKHFESVFTRFYQGHILPKKFGIDKRKAHFSSLICSNHMTRDDAIQKLKEPIYDKELLKQDLSFVTKKLGLSTEELEIILNEPPCSHLNYSSYINSIYKTHERLFSMLRPLTKLIPSSMKFWKQTAYS